MQIAFIFHSRLKIAAFALLATVTALAQLPLVEQGRNAINRGETAAAIDILEKAIAQSPDSAKAHYYLASAYGSEVQKSGMFAALKYAPKIKEEFQRAVELDPRYVDARYGLIQVFAAAPAMMGGSDEKAFEQAKEIKAIDPVFGHRAYAFIFTQQKKPQLARQEYLDGIREQPKSAKAHTH
jgi:Tfp pilus assembly protein PilF